MSKDDRELIERLRELLTKATALPWKGDLNVDSDMFAIYPDTGKMEFPVAIMPDYVKAEVNSANAKLATEAVNNLPALLTRLEALQAQPAGWKQGDQASLAEMSHDERLSHEQRIMCRRLAALTSSPPVVTPKWDVCRNCVDGSKAGQTCTVCAGRGHVPFVPTPVSPPVVEREAIARIIDPHSFMDIPFTDDPVLLKMVEDSKGDALRKADAILALTPVEGVGLREVLEQYSEDVHCTMCERLVSSGEAARQALLSTPVAQGGEVRSALERVIDPHIPLIPGMFDADQRSATIEDITDAVASLIAGLVKK